jgi:hypothetical protein
MSTDQPHDDLHELLVPDSLGELEGEDLARVERALREDDALREELEAIEATAAELVSTMPRHAAPPALRARVLDAVGAASDAERDPARSAPMYVLPRETLATPTVLRPSRWRRRALPAFSGALAVACALLLAWAIDLRGELQDARDAGARRTSQGDGAAPSWVTRASTHDVSTLGEFKQASGRLLEVDGQILLMIEDLPDPEPGTSWQVWTAEGDEIRNVAQWTNGRRVQLLVLEDGNVDQVMISHEATTEPVAKPGSAPLASVQV